MNGSRTAFGRRAASVLVTVVLLLPLGALPAHAADSATLTVTPTSVAAGSTVDFTFTFTSQLAALNGNPSTVTFDASSELPGIDPFGSIGFSPNLSPPSCLNSTSQLPVTPRRVTFSLQCGVGEGFSFVLSNVPVPAAPTVPLFTSSLTGPPGINITFNPAIDVAVGDPPTAPDLVSATPGDTEVSLAWTAPTGGDPVASYELHRSTAAAGPFADTGIVLGAADLSTTDTGLTNDTEYFYKVLAVNAFGSSESNVLSATPRTAPGAPTLDSATAGDGQVDLSWTAPAGTVTAYRIERAPDAAGVAGAFATLATPAGVGTTYTDATAVNGTTYWYRVVGLNSGVAGPASNELSATPQVAPPGAPTLVTAFAGDGQVALTWTAPTTGGAVATYRVERAPTGGAFAPVQAGLTTLTHTDTTVTNNVTYDYRVVAVNATAEATSNVLSATPQANSLGGGGAGGGGGPITPPITPPAAGRCVDIAPDADFADVDASNAHRRSIDCIAWKGVTKGTGPRTYGPAGNTTRGQMATFVLAAMGDAGVTLPAGTDHFDDDRGNVHQRAINRLAQAGIVVGTGPRQFDPGAPVRRDQMATMLINTYAYIRDEQISAGEDAFDDDEGNVHERNINAAAEKGLVLGKGGGRYDPAAGTRRDQMASFLSRLLEALEG